MARSSSSTARVISGAFASVTPTRLRLLLFIACAWGLLFAAISIGTVRQHERAVRTIAFDAAPSVMQAFGIKTAIQRMDIDVLIRLLSAQIDLDSDYTKEEFESRRISVGNDLVAAAKNITYGEAERVPIQNIQNSFGTFLMKAQEISDTLANTENSAHGLYLDFFKLVKEKLGPQCEVLNKVNADILDNIYQSEKSSTNLFRGLVAVIGLTMIFLLVYIQFYLSWRFRRRLSPPLIVATIAVTVFTHHLYTALLESSEQLRIAKEDAYDSLILLSDARSHAYAALADQSRTLFDPKNAEEYQKDFVFNTGRVAHLEKGLDYATVISQAQDLQRRKKKMSVHGFDGLLADELENVTFDGEAQDVLDALRYYSQYEEYNDKLQKMVKDGALDDAIRTCVGFAPDQRMFLFSRFDDAVGQALKVNREKWSSAATLSLAKLDGLVSGSFLVSVLVLVCVCAGLFPRIDEYVSRSPREPL